MKGHLKGLYNSLETFRKKLCIEENQIEAKRKQVTEEIVTNALKNEARRKDFEARWAEVKTRNLKALDEGTWIGPIVPIGLMPPEAPKEKKENENNEDEAEMVSFFRFLAEEPEGPPKGVGGASSGSCAAQVEAPPPEAPVEEVPPEAPVEDPVEAAPVEPLFAAPPPEAPVEGGSSGSGDAHGQAEASAADEVKKKVVEAPERLESKAYVALEEQFIAVAQLEDLREEDRKAFEAVRDFGVGVCSRCRWSSGCHSCDEDKAWGFYCRSTLWNLADEAVRPKAKPRGRPKKGAKD